jgi:hypothetical protein
MLSIAPAVWVLWMQFSLTMGAATVFGKVERNAVYPTQAACQESVALKQRVGPFTQVTPGGETLTMAARSWCTCEGQCAAEKGSR